MVARASIVEWLCSDLHVPHSQQPSTPDEGWRWSRSSIRREKSEFPVTRQTHDDYDGDADDGDDGLPDDAVDDDGDDSDDNDNDDGLSDDDDETLIFLLQDEPIALGGPAANCTVHILKSWLWWWDWWLGWLGWLGWR